MKPKTVEAHVVEHEGKRVHSHKHEGSKWGRFLGWVKRIVIKVKIGVAIFLDLSDLLFGNIPLINTIWDFVTMAVLLVTLRNKRLAFYALLELPLIGIPPLGIIDSLIPTATILTLLDIGLSGFEDAVKRHRKGQKL